MSDRPQHIFTKDQFNAFTETFSQRLEARLKYFNVPADSRDTIHKTISAQISRSIKVSPPPAVLLSLNIDMAAIAADIAIAALTIEMHPPLTVQALPGESKEEETEPDPEPEDAEPNEQEEREDEEAVAAEAEQEPEE